MANTKAAIKKMETMLDVAKTERVNAIPQLKTNPTLKRWFELGFWAGVDAHGNALSEMLKGAENGTVQEEIESAGDSGKE